MKLFAHAFVTIFVVMDPIGNIPIFLALTRELSRAERRRAGLQATSVAGLVVVGFAVAGRWLLSLLSISIPSIEIGGGVVLGLAALQLLLPGVAGGSPGEADQANVALVPLGTPLLAGPGAIAATLVFMRKAHGPAGDAQVILAIAATLAIVLVVLRYAGLLGRLIRKGGVEVLSRVFGLLLVAIAVQMIAAGAQQWAAGTA